MKANKNANLFKLLYLAWIIKQIEIYFFIYNKPKQYRYKNKFKLYCFFYEFIYILKNITVFKTLYFVS